jgi:hypothetical protein
LNYSKYKWDGVNSKHYQNKILVYLRNPSLGLNKDIYFLEKKKKDDCWVASQPNPIHVRQAGLVLAHPRRLGRVHPNIFNNNKIILKKKKRKIQNFQRAF